MIRSEYGEGPFAGRNLRTERLDVDLVVVGGGMAGTCCALTAAREGLQVVLLQDRPVLGGNASSEVRLWILGATSHMANNNRWAREGGVIDEILVENMYRNPEGNPLVMDTILLEKVLDEPNISLRLNTSVFDVTKTDADTIESVRAFCSQNSTIYEAHAPLFCDASGDGIVGFMSGAAFRMGAEGRAEFGEGWAPEKPGRELLGHSMYFYTEDTGKPVRFVPPRYALEMEHVKKIARYRQFNLRDQGCQMWWIEYGGNLDTVHDTERIKFELWRVVYGLWNYYKNSGEYPEAETMTLKWVGTIPGKRESRRFEGDYMLTQQDLVEQRLHFDAVSYGGWALDLHPGDGVYSSKPGAIQYHAKGVYQIPYRALYSKNIRNLFLAGRIISTSHIAFGSTRVMATCANSAQAVGMAAALCRRYDLQPAGLLKAERMAVLQRNLLRKGQFIPGVRLQDPHDLVQSAQISSSSRLKLAGFRPDGPTLRLDDSWALLIPVKSGKMPSVTVQVQADVETELRVELRTSSRRGNFTPDVTLAEQTISLKAGNEQDVTADFDVEIDESRYVFVCLMGNENVSVRCSEERVSGVLTVTNRFDSKVATSNTQQPPEGSGLDTFEFWRPLRRPKGKNIACQIDPPLDVFDPENVRNGTARPTTNPNAWAADPEDKNPTLTLRWSETQMISRIELGFDTDFDHPMETVVMGHPETAMPFCVRHYRIRNGSGQVIAEKDNNYQTRNTVYFETPIETDRLDLELLATHGQVPAALFEIRCYR